MFWAFFGRCAAAGLLPETGFGEPDGSLTCVRRRVLALGEPEKTRSTTNIRYSRENLPRPAACAKLPSHGNLPHTARGSSAIIAPGPASASRAAPNYANRFLAVAAWLPEHVAGRLVGGAGQDEQQVGQPVQVLGRYRVHGVAVGVHCGPGGAFGPAHDRPCHVQQRAARGAARQHEAPQSWKFGVEVVAVALERGEVAVFDAQGLVGRVRLDRVTEVGTDVEQFVLNSGKYRDDLVGQPAHSHRHPDGAVGLVYVGVSREPQVRLGGAATVAERGRAVVADPGVDAGQDDRGVAVLGHGTYRIWRARAWAPLGRHCADRRSS